MCMHKCMHRYKYSLALIGHLLKCRWKHSIVLDMCGSTRGELLALVSCSSGSPACTVLVTLSESNGFMLWSPLCCLGLKIIIFFDLPTKNNCICYCGLMLL